MRPGRFDRRIPVELPDLKGREEILKVHARKIKLGDNVDFNAIARAASGASGAELANMVNEAALRAVRENRKFVVQSDLEESIEAVSYTHLDVYKRQGVDMNGLRELGDQLKEKLGDGVVVLASGSDGKVSLMATATDGAMKKGAHAGNLVKAIAGCVGGGGGGRPNMAQAGGKNPSGIQDALKKAEEVLAEQIKE